MRVILWFLLLASRAFRKVGYLSTRGVFRQASAGNLVLAVYFLLDSENARV